MTFPKLTGFEEHSEHILAIVLQSGQVAVSSAILKQLIREVAMGVCAQETLPTVSLDDGVTGILPMLPPAYRYTMVGDLLTRMAYIMQGYLYGGMIDQDTKARNPISFAHFFCKHHPDIDYYPLKQLLESNKLTPELGEKPSEEEYHAVRFSALKPTFTFKLKQNSASLFENVVTMESMLDVSVSIKRPPAYDMYYQRHVKLHTQEPDDYLLLLQSCKTVGDKFIKEIPLFCSDLIAKLQVIQALVDYFSALKVAKKIPVLSVLDKPVPMILPQTLPYLYAQSTQFLFNLKTFATYLSDKYPAIWAELCLNPPTECTDAWFDDMQSKMKLYLIDTFKNETLYNQNKGLIQKKLRLAATRLHAKLLICSEERRVLLQELVESINQNKLYPCGLWDPAQQDVGPVLITLITRHCDQFLKLQQDKSADSVAAKKARAFKEMWVKRVAEFGTKDTQIRNKLFLDASWLFKFDVLVEVDPSYQEKGIPLLYPNSASAVDKGTFSTPVDKELFVAKAVSELREKTIEEPVVVGDNGTQYMMVKLAVEYRCALSQSAYVKLNQSLVNPAYANLFSPDDFKQLLAFIKGQSTTLTIDCKKTNPEGQSVLHYAVMYQAGSDALNALIVACPENIKRQDKFGFYPLHSAANNGHVLAVRLFMNHAPNQLNLTTKEGYSSLMLAAGKGHQAVVSCLLELKANPNIQLGDGCTALFLAIYQQKTDVAMVLLNHPETNIALRTANENTNVLIALEMRQDKIAQLLIEKGADLAHRRHSDGYDALAVSVLFGGSSELLQLILDTLAAKRNELIRLYKEQKENVENQLFFIEKAKKANADKTTNFLGAVAGASSWNNQTGFGMSYNTTSIGQESLASAFKCIQSLFSSDKTPNDGECHHALREINNRLVELDRPVTHFSYDGLSSLVHHAAKLGYTELVKRLVKFESVNATIKDLAGNTALMIAILHGHQELAQYLAMHSTINAVNKKRETASLLAIRAGQEIVLDLLLERGENPDRCDTQDESVLNFINKRHDACRFGQLKTEHQDIIIKKMNSGYVPPMFGPIRASRMDASLLSNDTAAIMLDDIDFIRQHLGDKKPSVKMVLTAIQYRSLSCLHAFMPDMDDKDWPELMHAAIEHRNEGVIKLVLDFATDRNIPLNDKGHTIAHRVVANGLLLLINHLAKHGVDFNRVAKNGDTTHGIAVAGDHESCLKALLLLQDSKPAFGDLLLLSVNQQSNVCRTYLLTHYNTMTVEQQEQVVLSVVKQRHDALLTGLQKRQPLSLEFKACLMIETIKRTDAKKIFKALLACNTNPMVVYQDKSPLDCAVSLDRIDVIRAFHQAGFSSAMVGYKAETNNPYTLEALRNQNTLFEAEKRRLLHAHEQRDAVTFLDILSKGFPVNELHMDEKHTPFLHDMFRYGCVNKNSRDYTESILKQISTTVDPLMVNDDGETLVRFILRLHSDGDKQRLSWIKKYFQACENELFAQELPHNRTSFWCIANVRPPQLIKQGYAPTAQMKPLLLVMAAKENNQELLSAVIQGQEEINMVDKSGMTPLMHASQSGHLKLVKWMIDTHHADPDIKSLEQSTALHYALMSQHEEVSLYLIEKTRDLADITNTGHSPFMLAAKSGLLSACRALRIRVIDFNQYNSFGQTCLHLSTINNHVHIIDYLIEQGMDVNALSGPSCYGESTGETSLHICTNVDVLICLLKHGGDLMRPRAKYYLYLTPLDLLLQKNDTAILDLLKQYAVFHEPSIRERLFFRAARGGNASLMQELIDLKKVNINSLNEQSKNALHLAIEGEALDTAMLLIERNILVEHPDQQGNTAMHTAALTNAAGILRMMIGRDLNVTLKNMDGETALYIACRDGHMTCVMHLILLESVVKIAANNGLTPAQIAWKKGHHSIAKLLFVVLNDPSILDSSFTSTLSTHDMALIKELEQKRSAVFAQGGNELHVAVSFQHHEAMRLICDLVPEMKQGQDALGRTPGLLAKALGLTAFEAMLSYYQGNDREPLIPRYLIAPPTIVVEQSANDIANALRVNGAIDATIITEISIIIAKLKPQTRQSFLAWKDSIKTGHAFFTKLADKDELFLKQIDKAILSRYQWDTVFETQRFVQVIDAIIELESPVVQAWFLSVTKPVFHEALDSRKWQSILTAFDAFLTCYKAQPMAKTWLALPPKTPISFHTDSDYLQRVQTALSLFTNPKQWAHVHALPSIELIQRAHAANLPFVCLSMVHASVFQAKSLESLPSIACYEEFRAITLASIATHRPGDFDGFSDLFHEMDKPEENALHTSHKWMLAVCVLTCIKPGWPPSMVASLVHAAINIKNIFGDSVFRWVFSPRQVLPVDWAVYVNTANQMRLLVERSFATPLQLTDACRQSPHTNLVQVVSDQYHEMLRDNMSQENIDSLRARFTSKSITVPQPMTVANVASYIHDYESVLTYCQAFAALSSWALLDIIKKSAVDATTHADSKHQLLAALRLVVFQVRGIYPYDTQILTLLIMLDKPAANKGRVAQVRTGEGKSTLVAMMAAYYAAQGLNVDVVTSSANLAERDEKEQREFFKAAGVTSSTLTVNDPTEHHFRGKIIYSTAYHFECSLLHELEREEAVRVTNGQPRTQDVAIVDEADNLLMDCGLNSTCVTQEPVFDTRWVYGPIYDLVTKAMDEGENAYPSESELRKFLTTYQGGQHEEQVTLFTDQQLKTWLASAKRAMNLKKDTNYIVQPEDIKVQNGTRQIIIINHGITGRQFTHARWGSGVHSFVEYKHGIDPRMENLSSISMAHVALFNAYTTVCALTGTMGSLSEVKELRTVYKLLVNYIPPHKPFIRECRFGYSLTKKDHDLLCIKDIRAMLAKNRPVLVICATIADTLICEALLKENKIHSQLLNDNQFMNEDYIIAQAGKPGVVTVATHVAGRGTDIHLDKRSIQAGGLHVIMTFLPDSSRVEDQGNGRAGRQGQPGSCTLLVHSNDPKLIKLFPDASTRANMKKPEQAGDTSKTHDQLQVLAEKKIKLARRGYTDEQSVTRVTSSKQWLLKFDYVKQFYHVDYAPIAARVRLIPNAAVIQHCMAFDQTQMTLVSPEMKYHRLMQRTSGALSILLREQQNMQIVDWSPVADLCRKAFLKYVGQKWAIVYSTFDSDDGLDLKEDEMKKTYSAFISTYLKPIQDDPQQAFLTFMNQMLSLAQALLPSEQVQPEPEIVPPLPEPVQAPVPEPTPVPAANQARDKDKELRVAADAGLLSEVKKLLTEGANINSIGPGTMQTALHRAVMKKHYDVVAFLIKSNASIIIADKAGKLAIDYANKNKKILNCFATTPVENPLSTDGYETDTEASTQLESHLQEFLLTKYNGFVMIEMDQPLSLKPDSTPGTGKRVFNSHYDFFANPKKNEPIVQSLRDSGYQVKEDDQKQLFVQLLVTRIRS